MSAMARARDPFSVLYNLVKKNNGQKLTDANETFEVISNRMGVLDNPQELVAFLGQHLKPKELEKKENGEVFTPPNLIQEKFKQLALINPKIWSDPSTKFLDPANGIGNYPALAFHHLMDGLRDAIPNEADRKKHILEKMLYMCELTKKNVEVSRKILDSDNLYALNLFQGSYLDLDPMKEWGVEKFDVIFGNPPYNNSHDKKKGQGGSGSRGRLYPEFVMKSIALLKDDGYLIFIHPAMWRKPNDILHKPLFDNQLHYLRIYTKPDGSKILNATTRVDWYILQKKKPYTSTTVLFDDLTTGKVLINSELPLICGHGHSIWEKMYKAILTGRSVPLPVVKQAIANSKCSKVPTATNVYPIMQSTSKKKGVQISWFNTRHINQYKQKVLWAEIEIVYPVFDRLGKFGTSDNMQSIMVSSEAEGEYICRYMSSKLFQYIIGATKWSNFRTDHSMFPYIPYPKDLPTNFTDAQVYAYFGLTAEEIGRVEAKQRGPGLTDYVIMDAPMVSVPPPPSSGKEAVVLQPAAATTTTQPDYKNMKVADLKQLCKDRKIKGITGKNKDELIAMLTASNK
jgi:hypothetical protein